MFHLPFKGHSRAAAVLPGRDYSSTPVKANYISITRFRQPFTETLPGFVAKRLFSPDIPDI
jgi:hypothetical protein